VRSLLEDRVPLSPIEIAKNSITGQIMYKIFRSAPGRPATSSRCLAFDGGLHHSVTARFNLQQLPQCAGR
jgi:hypothetical protein